MVLPVVFINITVVAMNIFVVVVAVVFNIVVADEALTTG